MNGKMDERLKEIESRLSVIKTELKEDGADIEKLNIEVDGLLEERKQMIDKIQNREILIEKLASGDFGDGVSVVKETEKRKSFTETPEYRTAFLKRLRNIDLSNVEKRVFNTGTSSAGSVVPTQTMNKILEKVKQYAPLLDKIDLMNVKGNVTIPAEGTTVEAQLHAENDVITSDGDTMDKVSLGAFEITKLITISKSVEMMSIDAFENWLTRKLAKKIAEKITSLILSGTGSNQPQGINAITWTTTNSVSIAKASELTAKDVRKAAGLLNGSYDFGAEWLMSKRTFFDDFHPLMDTSANNIITQSNGVYYVCGYPVTMDDRITYHEAFLGNLMEGYVGNLQEDINITSQFVTRENSYDFLGCAIFDGKVSAVEAFVKIVKATA